MTYLFEGLLIESHDHVRVHVEEAPVGVVSKPLVAGGVDDALFVIVVFCFGAEKRELMATRTINKRKIV